VIDDSTRAALPGHLSVSPVENLALKGFPHIRCAWRVSPVQDARLLPPPCGRGGGLGQPRNTSPELTRKAA
jgi:hypothetical protein